MNRKQISDYIEEHYPHDIDKILLADGFEEAFLGVVESFGTAPKATYDRAKCLDILIAGFSDDHHTMSYDEAVEYLEFNVTQAYVGEHTPAFIVRAEDTLDQLSSWDKQMGSE